MCGANRICVPGLFNVANIELDDGLIIGRRRIARHAILFRERDRLGTLFAVRFGQFKSTKANSLGEHSVAQFYMAGDLLGLDAIGTGRHNFRLTALENSEVCEISYAAITKTMATQPQFMRDFLQSMSTAMNDQADHSAVLAKASLDERFASFLLRLGARYERLGYSSRSFRLCMTRGEIGSYLGTTVESVSRLISRFNAQHAVSIMGRTVEIHDRDYLVSLMTRN